MDSSLNEEIDEGGILLNQAKAGPFSVVAKALQSLDTHATPFDSCKY